MRGARLCEPQQHGSNFRFSIAAGNSSEFRFHISRHPFFFFVYFVYFVVKLSL
jgi:hypothetical protein